jgi:hypothetical protein
MQGHGAASMALEPQSQALNFDPNGPGMGLDVDFNNFDLGDIYSESDAINVGRRDVADFGVFNNFDLDGLDVQVHTNSMNFIANFSLEDTLKDAELPLQVGPRETFQEADTTSHLPSNEKSDAALTRVSLADASEFNLGTSTHLEPHSNEIINELRAQKRKKTDEVDKSHILPEGSRRNRNKTARARGLDSLA